MRCQALNHSNQAYKQLRLFHFRTTANCFKYLFKCFSATTPVYVRPISHKIVSIFLICLEIHCKYNQFCTSEHYLDIICLIYCSQHFASHFVDKESKYRSSNCQMFGLLLALSLVEILASSNQISLGKDSPIPGMSENTEGKTYRLQNHSRLFQLFNSGLWQLLAVNHLSTFINIADLNHPFPKSPHI